MIHSNLILCIQTEVKVMFTLSYRYTPIPKPFIKKKYYLFSVFVNNNKKINWSFQRESISRFLFLPIDLRIYYFFDLYIF